MALMKAKNCLMKMNKNNLMKVFVFLSVFFMLITPLAYSKLEEGAGNVDTSDTDTSISSETTDTSPTDITKPSTETWTKEDEDFYDNVMGLSSEEQSKLTEEEINKFRNIPFRNVGDEDNAVRIPFNKETGDGNIGATNGIFEIKGYDQLCQFKTLTSKSGKVIFFGNSASDIESINIKDGEVININFKNKDSENEVLIAQAIGKGIWSSFSKEEQEEEGSISFEEENFITADKGISFRVGDNKFTVEESETKIKIEPIGDSDSYYDKGVYIGASIHVEQGEIYVEGETSKLKISYVLTEIKEEQEKIELNTKSLFSEDQKEFSILKETEKSQEKTEIIFGFDGSQYIFLQDFEKDQINFFEVPRIESVNGEQEPTSQQEEAETNIQLLQTEKEVQLLLQNKIQETLTKFKDSNSLLFEYVAEKEYNDYRIEKLEKAIENLDPSDTSYEEDITYLEEKKKILTNRNYEIDLLLKNEVIKDQYNEYLKLKDEGADIDKSLEEIETKIDELKDSVTSESTVEVKPLEDLDDDISQIMQQPPSESLAENTEKAKAVLEAAYNAAEEEKSGQHCWDACAKTYEEAGVGWQTVFVNLPEGDDRKVSINAPLDEQRDYPVPGDILEYKKPEKSLGHNVIFIEWVDKGTCQAQVAQQSTSTSPMTYRVQSLCGDNAPIIIWKPV